MSLSEYEGTKRALAEILRAAIALAGPDREATSERARDVFARIAENRFNLLVAGRFSRGKSSLMNAVLGMDRLLTGVLPVTSVITSVQYANPEALYIEYEGNRFGFEAPMRDLAEYTTELGNPGNRRQVQVARVGLPAEILWRGFCFVDSPGLGSSIIQNTRTTEAFLPEADALVMVSGFDGPLSDEEVRVLRLLSGSGLRLFFVLNKQDVVSPGVRQEVCDYVRGQLRDLWDGHAAQVFSLSALEGLRAKIDRNPRALAASGLADFERELTRFLVEERGAEFLRATCDRVERVLGTLRESAELNELKERTSALRDRARALKFDGDAVVESSTLRGGEHQTWGACELCAVVQSRLFEFLARYQHDLATFPEVARNLGQAGGLCGPHLRLYAALAAERDMCVALTPLLTQWIHRLRSRPAVEVAAMSADCRLCKLQMEAESKVIGEWQAAESVQRAPLENRSLCLPHLQRVIIELDERAVVSLMAAHASALERLCEDMQRYAVKRDGTRNELTTQDEAQAAQRALSLVAGVRTLVVRS